MDLLCEREKSRPRLGRRPEFAKLLWLRPSQREPTVNHGASWPTDVFAEKSGQNSCWSSLRPVAVSTRFILCALEIHSPRERGLRKSTPVVHHWNRCSLPVRLPIGPVRMVPAMPLSPTEQLRTALSNGVDQRLHRLHQKLRRDVAARNVPRQGHVPAPPAPDPALLRTRPAASASCASSDAATPRPPPHSRLGRQTEARPDAPDSGTPNRPGPVSVPDTRAKPA